MKPAVTLSAWNYCPFSCTYCVSGSNAPEWKLTAEGPKEITDFTQSLKWIDRYRPDATIHVSGGEPLSRPDIVDRMKEVIDAGYRDSTIFTNGLFLPERLGLLDLPLKWCITYHQDCGLSVDKWLSLVEPVREQRHVLHTVVSTFEHLRRAQVELKPLFIEKKWNYIEKWDRNPQKTMVPDFTPNPDDIEDIASNRITLIVPNGNVYPCNHVKDGPIGNVFNMTFDFEKAIAMNAASRSCAMKNACSAFQTAALFDTI